MQEHLHSLSPSFGLAPGGSGPRPVLATARLQVDGFKSMVRWQIEALAFLKRRYEADVKLVDDLFGGEDPNDAFDVVTAFLENAAVDYATEAGRVASIGSRLAAAAARRVEKEAAASAQDISLAAIR